ncbi:polymer-forming cytoskeletal protein [Oceanirhabdus sp. W0125-5]|uniref:polymer-forming cytoskeletal protein n=1 Tax=Oceanirhabdus sp. W0125-5 TaxID=2999116 RepID=UPI0022F2D4A5|nr:polymer-forming cytoskeletal protein [Oceanirhabdus sp. W0125-5]WBW98069.1 polymer-forming cytoskeletal protein [Oceanirhabdus sp. W0125-5]
MNEKIGDITLAGAGKVTGGRYRNVTISGAGSVHGDIECEKMSVSGAASIKGNIQCKNLEISGATGVDGNLSCEDINIAGAVSVKGTLNGNKISISGMIRKVQNCECDEFKASGGFTIKEYINADKVDIEVQGKCRVDEVVGEDIRVTFRERNGFQGFIDRIFNERASLCVDSIEGDNIHLEHTIAKFVRGKNITIGEECDIQVIEYSGEINVNDKSNVSEVIKL